VATVSEVAKRFPGWGGLIASLPLVSVLGMIWLWRDSQDTDRVSAYVTGALWFFAPSIPMFVLIPMLLRRGVSFWPSLASGCLLTIALYAGMVWGRAESRHSALIRAGRSTRSILYHLQ
jgi:hypothetical protein